MAGLDGKLDLLDRILSKNLAWISAADTKGTLLFAVDSAMLAVLAALVPPINVWTTGAVVAAAIAILFQMASIAFIVVAMFPRLNGPRGSLIYFGGIASHDEADYVRKIMDNPIEEVITDFARQCHRNAEIAKTKYDMVRRGVISGFLALPFWLAAIWLLYPLKFPPMHP